MIIPLSVNDLNDFELITWLDSESKKLGISRSAFIRMTLNKVRLGAIGECIDRNVNNTPYGGVSNSNKGNIAKGFINCIKK